MRWIILVSFLSALLVQDAAGQRLRVAVNVQDSVASGIFQSGFSAGFRALGDIDVVGPREQADYAVSAVVICDPRPCGNTPLYSLAIRLYEPVKRSTAEFLTLYALEGETATPRADSLVSVVWETMEGLERTHVTWVANWGRDAYQRAIRELVAEIDARCLDRTRTIRRLSQNEDLDFTERFSRIQDVYDSKQWLC